ncbi:MAG: maltose alpha-D-glucosyltransferase [bacterium]|nr:maltose alpha-D-glucosyltransferase [bacterium]
MIDGEVLWYKDAVIYQLHVKAFHDSNDDGIGDFRGAMERLDHITNLGATAIWVLPFYPSPLRDDGYDIADYRDVHSSYGTMHDFRQFVRVAHERGLRVITELVVNHTSDQHAWFQRARRAKPNSVWRNFYVWSDSDQKYAGTRIIFSDTERSNWTWDPVANAYYWHRFFSHQPDLNYDNPRVLQAILNVMRFWFDAGVDGLRLDAVPYLCEREGTSNENLPETHAIVKRLRGVLDQEYTGRIFLAEANQWPEDVAAYFGEGDECHMAFHFPLMPRMYMAVAEEDRYSITDIMRQTPEIPANCQWAIFLRNHDELTLEMVTDRERDYLYSTYATDPRARVNVGIRRRLAPLMENDRRKIELMNSLLLSMPGTPIIYYGDEIGMGDNIYLGDRDGVRTPMQWSPDRNGGFSKADYNRLYLPAMIDPVYGFERINVETQMRSPSSLLNWMKRLIHVRQAHRAFGRGSLTFLRPKNRRILAFIREFEGESILCVANLAQSPQACVLDLSAYRGRMPMELIGRSPFPAIVDDEYVLTLPGYAFYWFVLEPSGVLQSWEESIRAPLAEMPTLVLPKLARSLLERPASSELQRDVLPAFLQARRWFDAGETELEIVDGFFEEDARRSALVVRANPRQCAGEGDLLFVPLSLRYDETGEPPPEIERETLARVRTGAHVGRLFDALADDGFALSVLRGLREHRVLQGRAGMLRCQPAAALAAESVEPPAEVHRPQGEEPASTVVIGDRFILRAFRAPGGGTHPDVEMARFLCETAGFDRTPPYYGSVEYVDARGRPTTLLALRGLVHNQGNAWQLATDYLKRFLEAHRNLSTRGDDGVAGGEPAQERHAAFLLRAHRLGECAARLHRALAMPVADPAFAPEPVTSEDLQRWRAEGMRWMQDALETLRRVVADVAEPARAYAEALLARSEAVPAALERLFPQRIRAFKTRRHGALDLGRILVAGHEFFIVDFEGEWTHEAERARRKDLPLRDLASMLRSVDRAASVTLRTLEDHPEDRPLLEPLADEWRRRSAHAFLAAYRAGIEGCISHPGEPEASRLIAFFALELAFRELAQRIAERSPLLDIPLRAILRLLQHGEGEFARPEPAGEVVG